jgi:large subunit ribosomal protein L25
MAATELKAQARTGVGKGAARELRRQGLVPAVIYGDKKPPVPVTVSYNEAIKRIYAGGFLSHVITLDIDGEKHRVIPRDYQLDPVRDFPLHVDFLRIGAGSRIHVQVHVDFVNEDQSPGIKRGGVLNIVQHTLDLTCPAEAIPESVIVDLTGLDIGDSIHIGAVKLPEGVQPHTHDADLTVATIVAPSGLRSEEAEAGEAEEVQAEGEE